MFNDQNKNLAHIGVIDEDGTMKEKQKAAKNFNLWIVVKSFQSRS